jgi:glycosidase
MNEFLFGSLSTLEKRTARARKQRQGLQHNHRMEPLAPRPGDQPVVTVTVEVDQAIDRILCRIAEPETAAILLQHVKTEWDTLNWSYLQLWQATLPPRGDGTLVRYSFEAYPKSGHIKDGIHSIPVEEGKAFSYLVGDPVAPEWSRAAIIYQVFPDRFYPGDGRTWNEVEGLNDIHGGTLRGIIDKLDYIADLGFNCIWINPFFPDDTHHGYHATDYFTVNPRLGTLDEMRRLVAEAHRRSIRLLLDFVANHWGSKHETFQAALADRDSDYYNWYYWNAWPHKYETYYTVRDLPKINVDYPAARAYLMDSARYWLGEIGFDGLRLDHVMGPSHDFWTELRAVVKKVKPDAWMFGEATDAPDVQLSYSGRFDGCLDFMLAQSLQDTFASGTTDLATFDAFLRQHEAYYPSHFSRPSFLDNHDMDRFFWRANASKSKLKLAALCQFTLAGPPIVYNGTEVGVTQERSIAESGSQGMPECRRPMLWGNDQDQELLEYFRWLVHFRLQHPAIWRERRETVHVDGDAGTYAYMYASQEEILLVALNVSEEERHLAIKLGDPPFSYSVTLPPWSGDVHTQTAKD